MFPFKSNGLSNSWKKSLNTVYLVFFLSSMDVNLSWWTVRSWDLHRRKFRSINNGICHLISKEHQCSQKVTERLWVHPSAVILVPQSTPPPPLSLYARVFYEALWKGFMRWMCFPVQTSTLWSTERINNPRERREASAHQLIVMTQWKSCSLVTKVHYTTQKSCFNKPNVFQSLSQRHSL